VKHRQSIRTWVGWAAWLIIMTVMFLFGVIHLSARYHKVFLCSVLFLSLCIVVVMVFLFASDCEKEGGNEQGSQVQVC